MEIFSITSFTKEISRIDLIGILVGHLVFAIALTQILDWTWLKNLMSEADKLKMLTVESFRNQLSNQMKHKDDCCFFLETVGD